MIQQFAISRSVGMLCAILFIPMFVGVMLLQFQIPLVVKIVLLLYLASSAYYAWWREYHRQLKLQYTAVTNSWALSEAVSDYKQLTEIKAIYVNSYFVWLVMSRHTGAKTGCIIGRDSLPIERFLQLRRCILCPEVIPHSMA